MYRLNVHLIRMVATHDQPCNTSPPGLHKDVEKYIAVYLLGRTNANGGENVITDNSKKTLDRFELRDCGAGYIIDDDAVWHALTPVYTPAGERNRAFRDVLAVDFFSFTTNE